MTTTLSPDRWQPLSLSLPLAVLALALGGCATVGPDHQPPQTTSAAQWSSPLPHGGSVGQLSRWWQQFNDPVLARLQQAAEEDSPTLGAAWATVEAARATLAGTGASRLPTVGASASLTQARQASTGVATTRAGSLDASWELDLFGRLQRNRESAEAKLEARENDWHEARVTLAAEVASSYVEFRACGQLVDIYAQALASIEQTARATEALVRAGLSPGTDGALTQATRASTTASLLAQRAQCELLVKSLSNSTGLEDAELRQLLASGSASLPTVPTFTVDRVPAEVLRQRPDIAATERDLAAASASIGAAMADLYPSVQLGGAISLSATGASSISSWSFGPSLTLPLFDGGSRRAAVASARANHELAYAQWRDAVRNAVTEVEKALVRLADANQRVVQAEQAAQAYRRYLTGAESERRAGTISLLSFEDARRQTLSAELDLVGLQRDQVSYWIALYKALGGGWDGASPRDVTPPRSLAATPALPAPLTP